MARIPPPRGTLCIAIYGFLIAQRDAIPPRDRSIRANSKNLPFPVVTDPAAPPIRVQRHVPDSIATLHRLLVVAVAQTLQRCPWCTRISYLRKKPKETRRNL